MLEHLEMNVEYNLFYKAQQNASVLVERTQLEALY